MTNHAASRTGMTTRRLPRPIGVVLLIVGLVGLLIWQMRFFEADLHGTVAEDSIVADIVDENWVSQATDEDPENEMVLVIGKDQSGNVIWEGTDEEWVALHVEANDAYKTDLRNTWLLPSIAIAVVGLLLVVFGRRRTNTEDSRT